MDQNGPSGLVSLRHELYGSLVESLPFQRFQITQTKLLAKFEDGGIVFPDGNKWIKVPQGTNDRRPADMSTLKSD